MVDQTSNYPDLISNGRIFPLWVLHNFKKYKLDATLIQEGVDPCNIDTSVNNGKILMLRQQQAFIASYLDYNSPFRDLLLFHGLGSGKTAAIINLYNILYKSNPNWNIFLLVKAGLHDEPWMKELLVWINKEEFNDKIANIKFIHYDAPNADKIFIDAIKTADTNKKNMYIIEESHNFIKNVYNNITKKKGKKASTIYDHIQKEKREVKTRVILLSGTPAINNPFELALTFNLLRPGIFPMIEQEFNDQYIKNNIIEKKNMFQRRILGLVSYYKGYTSDLFAKENLIFVNCIMSKYQQEIYEKLEKEEDKLRSTNKGSDYSTYTR
jgi:hypothetical protein